MIRVMLLFALGFAAVRQARMPAESIEAFIDREMTATGVPGLAYAVVSGGEITSVGARGVLRIGGDERVTPKTPFLTGSISKSFTALAVMQLVEADKVDLDARLSHYLEVFSGRRTGAIKVRQLLSHTSGYSTRQGNESPADVAGEREDLARRVDRLSRLTPAYAPDEKWEYSNANYQILGRLIEVVSGQDYQSYVEANILGPIGMEDSFVADGKSHDAMATEHRPWFGGKRAMAGSKPSIGTAPQGGIIASARDLALYMLVMMNATDDLVSARRKAEMMRRPGGAATFYGFGWFVDSLDKTVWHSGSSPGFETLATMIPGKGKGVVVLVNGGSGIGFGETAQLREGITALALGLDYKGEGSRLWQKATFVAMTILPLGFLLSIAWAWRHRAAIRAKSGAFGLFSLWFPLFTTIAAAWVMLDLVPRLFGASLGTIRLFQPDLGMVMVASAATGVLWAAFRLGVAYSGKGASTR